MFLALNAMLSVLLRICVISVVKSFLLGLPDFRNSV